MKKRVQEEGLLALLGKKVAIWGVNYIYAGTLSGVNEHDVELKGAKVVYETGPLISDSWEDAQELPGLWYVRISAIESYGEVGHD